MNILIICLSSILIALAVHRSLQYTDTYEREKLERYPYPITIDSAWFVSETMNYKSSKKNVASLRWYMRQVNIRTAQIFAWHNIIYRVVNIKYFEEDPLVNTEDIEKDYWTFLKLMKNYEGIKGEVDNTVFFRNMQGRNSTLGIANLGMIGKQHAIALIEAGDRLDWDVTNVAVVIAHEVGHNLHLKHSYSLEPECVCPASKFNCLMSPYAHIDDDIHPLDRCSVQSIKSLTIGKAFEKPIDKPSIFTGCGNGVVEENEQCDCGFDWRVCESRNEHRCCNGKTCTLFDNATCSSGSCCVGCKVSGYGHVCHIPEDECSYPSVCSGNSAECDVIKKPDGVSCKNEKGNCYDGKCVTLDDSCLNFQSLGPRFVYSKSCKKYHTLENFLEKDVCSYRVYCIDELNADATIDHTNEILCRHTMQFRALPFDGTPCGPNKMCLNEQCIMKDHVNMCKGVHCRSDQVCDRNGKCIDYNENEIRRRMP